MALASDKRILVVDDEPDIRDFLSTCVEDAGFQVQTAFDGQDALEKIEKRIPDLITLDLAMPRMTGGQLMKKLRENQKWSKIPVIIITAHAKDEMGQNEVKELKSKKLISDPQYIIEKPITPLKLVSGISKILNVEPAIELATERNELLESIKSASPEKLKEIQELLNK